MTIVNVNGISGINSITAQSTSLNFYTAAGNNLPITAATLNVGTGASISSPATNVLTLGTNNVEVARFDSSGNLGIGTASPSEKTHISGTGDIKLRVGTTSSGVNANAALSLTSTSEGSWVVQTGNAVSSGLRFYDTTAGAERFRIASNGAWGLSGANYGSSGEVLTSNGSGSAPTWQGLSILGSTSQTWTNVLSSRSNGTTYTNSTGRPIMVILSGTDNPNQALNYTFQVQGSNIGVALPNVAHGYSMILGVHVVPNGQTYRAAWNGAANLSQWWELR